MGAYAKRQEKEFNKNKPCPFCHHPYSFVCVNSYKDFTVQCLSMECLAIGPSRDSKRKAVLAWNKRKK